MALGDNIRVRDMDLDTMIRKARTGNLNCGWSPYREFIGQRAFRLESAEEIINAALAEGRAMNADECRRVDDLTAEAETLGPVIKEFWERDRRELEAACR